jgi:hypothetical protein
MVTDHGLGKKEGQTENLPFLRKKTGSLPQPAHWGCRAQSRPSHRQSYIPHLVSQLSVDHEISRKILIMTIIANPGKVMDTSKTVYREKQHPSAIIQPLKFCIPCQVWKKIKIVASKP